ncbi:MAG: class I SAM-dependent methyltransferase [Alphaproteobacteria bacterium]|nr:class I SAM-dependent methyltransferase [Alphaproteobacteria bacterium]MBV8408804.1 class I SAM-dependent methyltransferase [Alphaproteobacteria bacterium]
MLRLPGSDPTQPIDERLADLSGALWFHPRRRALLSDLQALMAEVDDARLAAVRATFAGPMQRASAESRYKYLDVAYFTLQKLKLAHALGLDRGPPRRVLDIGTGAGHFPFVLRHFGHEVVAIDIADPVYEGVAACLGVRRTLVRIEPEVPLPELGGRFDLVVAYATTFNVKRTGRGEPRRYWSLAEWQFLFDDLCGNQLRRPGRMFVQLNEERHDGWAGFRRLAYNRDLLTMAARNGAIVSRRRGTIETRLEASDGDRIMR